jgi:hypothetical protein
LCLESFELFQREQRKKHSWLSVSNRGNLGKV